MRITAATISDYKRVRTVTITPDADRALVLIGGKNRQGKSSILDALSAAIGGAKMIAGDPVRHGAEHAEIVLELEDGTTKLTVRRTINPDKSTTLEVRDELGPRRSPQTILDNLLGARFIDPLGFLALPDKEQRARLMKMIPNADRIAGLNEKRERAYAKRTEVGRDHDKATAELSRLELAKTEPGELLDVAALAQEQRDLAEQQRQGEAAGFALRGAERDMLAAQQRVEQLERELNSARVTAAATLERHTKAKAELDAAGEAWLASAPRREHISAELARAGQHNAKVIEARQHAKRRDEVAAEAAKYAAERESLSEVIAKIDARKAEILAEAKLPVDGLEVTDDGIMLAGVPFAQASAAERMRVALALAVASSPGLDDIWVRDGALLDDEMLAAAVEHAAAAKKRLWVEVIDTSNPEAIVIRDGKVAERVKGAA